jgi:hypothetical protein
VNQRSSGRNELIISYLFLRKIVGWIGGLLPIVLIGGGMLFVTMSPPGSMSGYYYTAMRDVLVGALCVIGIFLAGYDGYDELDRWITNVAGLGAIGVAFFPTKPPLCAPGARICLPPTVARIPVSQQVVGGFHVFFAAVTFIALGLMALRFAKSEATPDGLDWAGRLRHELGLARPSDGRPVKLKRLRNVVYRLCGVTILSCVVLAALSSVLSNVLPASVRSGVPLVLIFEALAVFAFGISWFVKGQALPFLRDDKPLVPALS